MELQMNESHISLNSFSSLSLIRLCLLTILLSSCSLFTSYPAAFSVKELAFPKAENYDALVNTNDGLTVLLVGGDLGDLQSYARENDREFENFDFPDDDPSCDPETYHSHESSIDGRLQVWEWCLTGYGGIQYLRVYDWNTGQLGRLSGPLPLGSSGASWNPDQTKAIVYLDSGFATRTLYWLAKDGFSPLDLVITDGSRSWNLKDDFPDFKADDTGKTGSTGEAAWSPDGKSIAFFASPNAVGKTGFDRFGVEYYLYLMDPETLGLSLVAKKIYSPFLIQWSPDSTHIAFIGEYGFWKEEGLWLYSLKDQSITNIAKGIFQGLAWTSNKSLAAIHCEDRGNCRQVFEYNLTNASEP